MELTRVAAIKMYLEQDGPGSILGRKVENREMMTLSKDERKELGDLALTALGATLKEV